MPVNTPNFNVIYNGRDLIFDSKCDVLVTFDGTNVNVKVPPKYKRKMTGLCGDCNGEKDDMRTKDGKNVKGMKNQYSLVGDSYVIKTDESYDAERWDFGNLYGLL